SSAARGAVGIHPAPLSGLISGWRRARYFFSAFWSAGVTSTLGTVTVSFSVVTLGTVTSFSVLETLTSGGVTLYWVTLPSCVFLTSQPYNPAAPSPASIKAIAVFRMVFSHEKNVLSLFATGGSAAVGTWPGRPDRGGRKRPREWRGAGGGPTKKCPPEAGIL